MVNVMFLLIIQYYTGCNITDLVVEVSYISSLCLRYPNGLVCVTGSEVGSVATYLCNDGYTLEGGVERMCESDGKWNASMPTCKEVPGDGILNYLKHVIIIC